MRDPIPSDERETNSSPGGPWDSRGHGGPLPLGHYLYVQAPVCLFHPHLRLSHPLKGEAPIRRARRPSRLASCQEWDEPPPGPSRRPGPLWSGLSCWQRACSGGCAHLGRERRVALHPLLPLSCHLLAPGHRKTQLCWSSRFRMIPSGPTLPSPLLRPTRSHLGGSAVNGQDGALGRRRKESRCLESASMPVTAFSPHGGFHCRGRSSADGEEQRRRYSLPGPLLATWTSRLSLAPPAPRHDAPGL